MKNSDEAIAAIATQTRIPKGALLQTNFAAYADRPIADLPLADQHKVVSVMAAHLKQERVTAQAQRRAVTAAMIAARKELLADATLSTEVKDFIKNYCPCE